METPVTQKHSRPFFGRSHSERLSPTHSRLSQATQPQPSKRKHLHPLQTTNDRLHRHGHGERLGLIHSAIDHHPITDLGRFTSRASTHKQQPSSNVSRQESPVRAAPPEPVEVEPPPKPISPQDVEKEKTLQVKRDEELSATYNGLLELAHDNTRRLDKLSSAILEKVQVVRTTIRDLQELSQSSSELHRSFGQNSAKLENDTQTQIDVFANFSQQQSRVDKLVARVDAGMAKTKSLSDRLEVARGHVESWEIEENKWQARTTLRLKITWSCLGAFAALLVLLLVLRAVTRRPQVDPTLDALPPHVSELMTSGHFDSRPSRDGLRNNVFNQSLERPLAEEEEITDPRLRLLDEL